MKKISREECYQTALVNLWNHIDALQKEVERLESENGFTVDWSRAPDRSDIIGCAVVFTTWTEARESLGQGFAGYIPRPPTETRERTAREKNTALRDFICLNPNFDFGDASTVEEMLTRANISLTVTEE